jgi:GT2 family glycosyltransferase
MVAVPLGAAGGVGESVAGSSISVVVCTRDRPTLLERSLAALAAAIRPQDQLVVVDSASTDAAVRTVAGQYSDVVVRCDLPGLARARNAGIAAADRAVIAFTDDDCLVAPSWSGVIAGRFDADRSLGFVTGRVEADREVGVAISVLTSVTERVFTSTDDLVGMGHGANMAFRRAALADIGGFDELLGAGALFPAAEDTDAFWRVLRTGWRGSYSPDSIVTHVQWRSKADKLRVQYGYGRGEGALTAKARTMAAPEWRSWLRRSVGAQVAGQVARSLSRGKVGAASIDVVHAAGFVSGFRAGRHIPVVAGRLDLSGLVVDRQPHEGE